MNSNSIFKSLAFALLLITCCDLVGFSAAVQDEDYSIFLCETETEEVSEEFFDEIIPALQIPVLILSQYNSQEEEDESLDSESFVNLSPHCWSVPIFIDNSVYRL